MGTADGKPAHPVKIVECGETSENKIQAAVGKDTGNTGVYLCSDVCISLCYVCFCFVSFFSAGLWIMDFYF